MARLVGESGPVAGKTWVIDPGVTLGREGHNSIPMPENRKASRDHAKVWREGPGRYAVADLGSTNGTLVNDGLVTKQTLVDGDELRVGEATFRFLLDDEEKPKRKEGPARMQDVFGASPGAAAAGTSPAAAASGTPGAAPTIEVKSRILQYSKKPAKGSVASYDIEQTAGWQKAALWLTILAIAGAAFFGVMKLVGG